MVSGTESAESMELWLQLTWPRDLAHICNEEEAAAAAAETDTRNQSINLKH